MQDKCRMARDQQVVFFLSVSPLTFFAACGIFRFSATCTDVSSMSRTLAGKWASEDDFGCFIAGDDDDDPPPQVFRVW